MKARVILISVISLFLFFNSEALSQEWEESLEEPVHVHKYPEIKPEFSTSLGYRFLDHSGSGRAGEFEYLNASVTGELIFTAFPFPHRIHLKLDLRNKEDFFADVRYAYKDIILFRGLTRGLSHNLDNRVLFDYGPSSQYTVEQRDKGRKYNTSNRIDNFYLRFKLPDFPFHVFVNTQIVTKEGSMQERFLSNYLPVNRVSQSRDIDWQSRHITVGTNAHLGPVEVEVSHGEKELNVGGDSLSENSYDGNLYPLNLTPEIKGSSTSLKIHTSYTGRLVAAATVTKTKDENQESGAKADRFSAATDIMYMPDTNLTFFLKYRHKRSNINNPDKIPVNYLDYISYTSPIFVRPSIDSTSDKLSGTLRYRAMKEMTLYGEYSISRIERENNEEWKLPHVTEKHTISLWVNARPVARLNIKAKYTHQEIDAPAYNTQPDRADEGRVSVSWIPTHWINGLLSYSLSKDVRDEIYYIDENIQISAKDRDKIKEKFFGSLAFFVTERLSITPSYSYMRNKTVQSLLYNNIEVSPEYNVDSGALYRDISHVYAVNFDYFLNDMLNLNLDISYTISKGIFDPGALISDVSSAQGSDADADIRETGFTVRTDYDFRNGWKADARYSLIDYDDRKIDSNDGTLHLVFLSFSRKW
jgi:hypothetical protein